MKRQSHLNSSLQSIKVSDLDIAIEMLETYLDANEIEPLMLSLKALKQHPDDETLQSGVTESFNNLGPLQGAVLTYAPYLNIFVSDDPFGISHR